MTAAPDAQPPSPATAPSRVALVDRRPLDRELLAQAVGRTDGFALALATTTLVDRHDLPAVDIVVVRASAPGTDLQVEVATAAALSGRPRVVVLSGYADAYLVECLQDVGADAVSSCDISFGEVLDLMRGEAPAPPVPLPMADRHELGLRHHLTTRELEILDHLADGLAPGQIAHLLQLRISTIRDHVKSLRSKLECSSATQLVITAHRLGLVPHVGRPLR